MSREKSNQGNMDDFSSQCILDQQDQKDCENDCELSRSNGIQSDTAKPYTIGRDTVDRWDCERWGTINNECIGKGTYGNVSITTRGFAVKRMVTPSKEIESASLMEMALIQFLNTRTYHPFILHATQFCFESDDHCLIMPLYKPLHVRSWKRKEDRWKLMGQLFQAIDYCHQYHIIHRDIKPTNVLLDSDENAILIDFGMATIPFESRDVALETHVASVWYRSPEIWLHDPYYGTAVDMWSLGVVWCDLLEIHPFRCKDEMESMFRVFHYVGKPDPQEWTHKSHVFASTRWSNYLKSCKSYPTPSSSSLKELFKCACSDVETNLISSLLQCHPDRRRSAHQILHDMNIVNPYVFVSEYPLDVYSLEGHLEKEKNKEANLNLLNVAMKMDKVPALPFLFFAPSRRRNLTLLFEWLKNVHLYYYEKESSVLLVRAISLFYSFLGLKNIQKDDLQGYAYVCLIIASKLKDRSGLSIMNDNCSHYSCLTLLQMERDVVVTLNLGILDPTTSTFFDLLTPFNTNEKDNPEVEEAWKLLVRFMTNFDIVSTFTACQIAYVALQSCLNDPTKEMTWCSETFSFLFYDKIFERCWSLL